MAERLTHPAFDRAYFERVYAEGGGNPWDFETSRYEQRKYDLTLAALPAERYHRAFEPGCSIGVLSERLAARCDELVAMEPVLPAAAATRKRLQAYSGASVIEGTIPETWPPGQFDLIVLSEVLYYLSRRGFEHTIERLEDTLAPGGTLISVHYLLETDYPLSGAEVGARLRRVGGLKEIGSYREQLFELLVFQG